MFKAPSLAKGSPARKACDESRTPTDDLVLAARLEHLIAIGGESGRQYLFSPRCTLTQNQIAKLCRRMPPFITVKLKELEAGETNIERSSPSVTRFWNVCSHSLQWALESPDTPV
jgi:hypothetical protein